MSIDQYGWPPMNGQSVKNWAPEVKHARKIFLLHKKTFLQIQTLELYQLFRVWRPTNMLRFFLLIFLLVLVFYQVYLGSWMICIFAWLSHRHCHCPGGGRAQGWAGWRREVFGRQILVLVLKILLFVLKILLFIKIVLFVFQVEMLFCNNHCSKRGRIGEPFFSHDSLEWTTAWKPKQAYSPMGPGEAGFPDQAHPPGHHHHPRPPGHHHHPRPPPGEAGFPDQAHPLAHQDHPALLGNEKIFLNTIKSFFSESWCRWSMAIFERNSSPTLQDTTFWKFFLQMRNYFNSS